LRDAPDYAALRSPIDGMATPDYTMADLYAAAVARLDEPARRIAMRIRNLGIADWSIWAHGGDTPVLDALPDDWRVLVADVGQLGSPLERSVLASAALEWLWSRRHERQPRLVVIDEAHNVCPQLPTDASQAMATDTVIRIAAEGRKYGLYLLLSTQQPQKIHANVLAQCDNLMLLRMNSSIDIDHLAQVFSFVPEPLLRQAATFRLGQGLVAGRFSSHPVLYQGARRWTREGGADIPTTWARPAG
jgi:hypothetical protein